MGISCSFQRNGISLLPSESGYGLPNLPNYRLGPLTPTAEAGPNDSICHGDLTQIGRPDTNVNHIFQWVPATGLSDPTIAQPTASPSQTTTYYLMVTDTTVHSDCASAEDSVTIFVVDTTGAPVANAGADTTVCPGEPVLLGTPDSNPNLVFLWTPATGLSDPTAAQPTASPSQTTTYQVSVSDTTLNTECTTRSDSVTVFMVDLSNLPIADTGLDTIICSGDAVLLGGPVQTGLTYQWTPAAGLDDPTAAQPIASPTATTTYTLIVWDSLNGQFFDCRQSQASVTVEVEQPFEHAAPEPQTFCSGEVLLIGVAPQSGFQYAWSPREGLQEWTVSQTKVRPEESVLYTLSITDPSLVTENCRSRDFPVPLSAEDCVLQNVLTPNGDGVNDVLDLGDFNGPVTLVVYNRWGKQVFVQDGYQNLWDGGRVPEGVYYYVLRTQEGEKAGHFNLIR